MALEMHRANEASLNLQLQDGPLTGYGNGPTHGWPSIAFQQPPHHHPLSQLSYPYSHQRMWCKQEQDTDISHGFHDINHQLQLGSTQNFLQPSSVMHNIMSLDSASMEQSSGSSMYGSDASMVPMMGTVIVQDGNGNAYLGNNHEDQSMLGSADHGYQQARNYYYQSQQTGLGKGSVYDQAASSWIPTAVPAARTNNVAVCHGAPTFTVWNDT